MISMFSIRGLIAASALMVLSAAGVSAAELVMYRTAGCPWCAKWDAEIAPIYPSTEAGRRAPLRKVDHDREKVPEIALVRPVRYSPTFVLVEDGREIGRIEGYPGEDFFWGLLENLVLELSRRESTVRTAPVR